MNIKMSVDVSKALADLRKKGDVDSGITAGYQAAGLFLEAKMVEKINSNIPPPLSTITIKRKGSTSTLIDTGEMMGAVTSQLDNNGIRVGIIGDGINATKGAVHEFGAPAKNIPERSWMRSTVKANRDKTVKIFAGEIVKRIETR